MNGNQRWFGWIAIGLSALALVVAFAARGFGPQIAASMSGTNGPQTYTQPGASAPQGAGQAGGGAPQGAVLGGNVQPNTGQQPTGPQSGVQAQRGGGQRGNDTRQGSGMQGADRHSGPGRSGDAGFGRGGWFSFVFGWLGGLSRMGMLALLVVLGVWLIRGRGRANATGSGQAVPAHEPPPTSPTGEVYTDTPDEYV